MLHEPVPERRFVWRIDRERMTATLDLPLSRMRKIEVDPNYTVVAKFPKKYLPE